MEVWEKFNVPRLFATFGRVYVMRAGQYNSFANETSRSVLDLMINLKLNQAY
jgi:hypothetical protein